MKITRSDIDQMILEEMEPFEDYMLSEKEEEIPGKATFLHLTSIKIAKARVKEIIQEELNRVDDENF
jgi:hypothetical protein